MLSFSSGKNDYDVVGMDYAWMQQYVNSGYLTPLNDMATKAADTIKMNDYIKAYVDWGNHRRHPIRAAVVRGRLHAHLPHRPPPAGGRGRTADLGRVRRRGEDAEGQDRHLRKYLHR